MDDLRSSPARRPRRCPICKAGCLEPGTTTVALDRGEAVLVLKDVPALVCDTCGEGYTGSRVTDRVLEIGKHDHRAETATGL